VRDSQLGRDLVRGQTYYVRATFDNPVYADAFATRQVTRTISFVAGESVNQTVGEDK
jgi:hypothetical protein